MTYTVVEPEKRTVFYDVEGKPHSSREDAIDANFAGDFADACAKIVKEYEKAHGNLSISNKEVTELIRWMIDQNPEMVRVALGDRPPN